MEDPRQSKPPRPSVPMNDIDSTTPFTDAERKEITENATRAQYQRGTQGLWARRWLRLEAMLREAEREGRRLLGDIVQLEAMEDE